MSENWPEPADATLEALHGSVFEKRRVNIRHLEYLQPLPDTLYAGGYPVWRKWNRDTPVRVEWAEFLIVFVRRVRCDINNSSFGV